MPRPGLRAAAWAVQRRLTTRTTLGAGVSDKVQKLHCIHISLKKQHARFQNVPCLWFIMPAVLVLLVLVAFLACRACTSSVLTVWDPFFHPLDHSFAWCRVRHLTVWDPFFHSLDHSFAWCLNPFFHPLDHSFAWCRVQNADGHWEYFNSDTLVTRLTQPNGWTDSPNRPWVRVRGDGDGSWSYREPAPLPHLRD